MGARAVARRDRRDLPLQGRHDTDARRLLGGRDRPLSGGPRRTVNRLVALIVLMIGGVLLTDTAHAQQATTQINIDAMRPGTARAGLEFTLTGGGPVSAWKVVADPTAAAQKAIAKTSADGPDYRFPLALYEPLLARNVDVIVRFKPVGGTVDQAGGIAVRLASPDDYYVVRANALEDNVRFYRVVKGSRQQIQGANLKVAANQWHTLGLRAQR